MIYEKILRPILFKIDPENIHSWVIHGLSFFSRISPVYFLIRRFLFVEDDSLKTTIGKVKFSNPVGLAAGFDKYVIAPKAYPMLGFGMVELGSITNSALPGNPKPRLWRIPEDSGLIVYYGLANGGADNAVRKMNSLSRHEIPYGISIAPTTGLDISKMAGDYIQTLLKVHPYADYITLNVSCPNVASCDKFAQVSFILELIAETRSVMDKNNIQKDIFLKIGAEFKDEELDKVIDCCISNGVTGIVATNLIKDRSTISPKSSVEEMNHPGGISGSMLSKKSENVIKYIRKRAGDKLKIIGVGGIFTAEDAYDKIRSGADAVQLITGFIYGGPLAIKKINQGLVKLLKRDGFKNIEEAVGGQNS